MGVSIKVGFLVSYDYKYLFNSLPLIYDHVDEVFLALDINRITWSGELFTIEDSFFDFIQSIDIHKKIIIYEDDFYVPQLSPIENDTRERNMLSQKMGSNCWQLQIDADEYFLNFAQVSKFLRKNGFLLSKPNYNAINLKAKWVTLFKRTEKGYLYIDNEETFSFATNQIGKYDFARDINSKIRNLQTNFIALHHSWAREPKEILFKINNWGHKDDFDRVAYFDFWKNVNENNYTEFKNFHSFLPNAWDCLQFIPCKSVTEFIQNYKAKNQRSTSIMSPRFYLKYLEIGLKNAVNTLNFRKK